MPEPCTTFGGRDWSTYYAAVAGKPPRETLELALAGFARDDQGAARYRLALDLGCGEGRDTRELLQRGWSVVAVDPHPDAARRCEDLAANPSCIFVQATLEAAAGGVLPSIPSKVDLVNASFVLPFVPPEHFARVWAWIRTLIAPGGRFAGQFFGPRDAWATIPGRSHHRREEIAAMLEGLTIEQFREEEKEGTDAEGNAKHWHAFHVVAAQP